MKAIQEPRPGMDRRTALKAGSSMTVLGLAIAAGLIPAREALAQAAGWNKAAFDTKTLADVVRSLGGSAPSENKGELVPAHFIQTVNVTHNGKTVMSAEWGPAVAKNPFLHFRFKGGKAGEKLAITWFDNKGDKRTDETTISGG